MDPSDMLKVNELLLKEWDPIGISNTPGAEDEYSQYVEDVCKFIQDSNSFNELFSFLWQIETQYMGLKGNKTRTENFAKMLFNRFHVPK